MLSFTTPRLLLLLGKLKLPSIVWSPRVDQVQMPSLRLISFSHAYKDSLLTCNEISSARGLVASMETVTALTAQFSN